MDNFKGSCIFRTDACHVTSAHCRAWMHTGVTGGFVTEVWIPRFICCRPTRRHCLYAAVSVMGGKRVVSLSFCLSVCPSRPLQQLTHLMLYWDVQCWNWPKRTGGSAAEMFEILPRDWNLKPIFTQKWASVEMNWGFNPQPRDNSNTGNVYETGTRRFGSNGQRLRYSICDTWQVTDICRWYSTVFLVPSSQLWLKYRPPPDCSETHLLLDVCKSSYS